MLHPVATWAPISYASSVAFDTCVLVLTVAKLRFYGTFSTARSNVGRQVYNDNLLYFFLMTAANATVLSIQAQHNPRFDLIKPAAVPFSTLMTVTMGTRVFLNLRLFNQRQQSNLTGNQLQLSHQSSSSHSGPRQPILFNTRITPSPSPSGGKTDDKVSASPL